MCPNRYQIPHATQIKSTVQGSLNCSTSPASKQRAKAAEVKNNNQILFFYIFFIHDMSWTHFLSFQSFIIRPVSFLAPPPPPPQSIQEIYTDFFISQWKKTICLFTFLFPWNQKLRPLVWHNKQNNKVNPTWDTTIVKAACYTYSYFWRKTQVKNIFLTNKNDKIQWQSRHSSFNKNRILHSHFFPSDQGDLKYIYIHSTCIKKHERIYKKQWGVGGGDTDCGPEAGMGF